MKNSPTPKQVQQFAKYVGEFQQKLNLLSWRIEGSGSPADEGSLAQVDISLEDRLAVWSLGDDWHKTPINAKTLREAALHEILHVALCPLISAAHSRDPSHISVEEHALIIVLEKLLK